MSRPRERVETSGQGDAARELQIVDCTCRRGAVSVPVLCALSRATESAVRGSIHALQRGGLRIEPDENENYRIRAAVPGFALRLTDAEAAVAWGNLWAWRTCPLRTGHVVSPAVMERACLLLERALRRYHPESEELARRLTEGGETLDEAASRPSSAGRAAKLTGSVRAVMRRLRIVDLTMAEQMANREAIAEAMNVSTRTVARDLGVMERAGLRLAYRRDDRCYRFDCMHGFLNRELRCSGGPGHVAALLALFDPGDETRRSSPMGFWPERSAAAKMTASLMRISGELRHTAQASR